MATSLITGGAGFIGSHVAKHCQDMGHKAIGLQPVDFHLHGKRKILHTEADAVEPHRRKPEGPVPCHAAGIRLQRNLRTGHQAKAPVDAGKNAPEIQKKLEKFFFIK